MRTSLAIAACGPRLELALVSPALAAPALVALAGPTPRSELVMAAIDLLLRGAGLERGEIESVVASRGPGSFTGVRVALATVQGLALALGVPAHGFSSLLAQAARTDVPETLAVQPARRGFAYAQGFARRGTGHVPIEEPRVVPLDSLVDSPLPVIAPAGMALPATTPLALTRCSTAEALLDLLAAEEHPDAATLTPVYLEPPPASPPVRTAPPWPPSRKAS